MGWWPAVVASGGAVGIREKMAVQDLGLRLNGGGFGALPRRHRRQAAGPGCEKHGDVPWSTYHSDMYLAACCGHVHQLT